MPVRLRLYLLEGRNWQAQNDALHIAENDDQFPSGFLGKHRAGDHDGYQGMG